MTYRPSQRNRIANPNHNREVGRQHAHLTPTLVDRQAVINWSPGWTDEEIDSYLAGRAAAVTEITS